MSCQEPANYFFIGWDVGGWNCDKNANSRDSIVILDSALVIVGKPWRGNLRTFINEAKNAKEFIRKLFSLCYVNLPAKIEHVTLSIDTPLGFSVGFTELVTGLKFIEPVGSYDTNPYLYRQTERYLFEHGLTPLSAIKDMIGSQATKGIHVLAKFASEVKSCGVWSDGELLTAIEAYPAACKNCGSIETLRQQVANQPVDNQDKTDALTCALIGYLFSKSPEKLIAPQDSVPPSEGWIWVPKDILKEVKP
ncbi:hypothetical protein MSSIH_0907 [Methanosarcina siciliae HI350]|uniref:DUF429 domain-containing protein n=1 Tax=Methanosarcina siciliae HI350 TaxID=1434119 RepID=A0A0E3PD35_9EURY|nr:hypothetical protein [Methanosarcina siciliae]AKB31597.1 hypothetical protein MSSIH_0907 [Methanosarcina siciliae HI350]